MPVSADAIGNAVPIASGLRVTFGPGRADLNPRTEAALRDYTRGLVVKLQTNPASRLVLVTYAAGERDDLSTPRRLALQRALTVRALLLTEGIASPRILVRAVGLADDHGPADRADLSFETPGG